MLCEFTGIKDKYFIIRCAIKFYINDINANSESNKKNWYAL
jgi:hypothetical protein